MIPHKLRKYRAILDLSFALVVGKYELPLVNEATIYREPPGAMDQIGLVLPQIIKALAYAPLENGDISFSKLNIKDGFWRMTCQEGEEWKFAYVLPSKPRKKLILWEHWHYRWDGRSHNHSFVQYWRL